MWEQINKTTLQHTVTGNKIVMTESSVRMEYVDRTRFNYLLWTSAHTNFFATSQECFDDIVSSLRNVRYIEKVNT